MKSRSCCHLICGLAACIALPVWAQTNPYPFQNPALPLEERVNNAVSLMTLDEKIAFFSSHPGVPRLGIRPMGHVEGLHGVARGGPSNWAGAIRFPPRFFRSPSGWGRHGTRRSSSRRPGWKATRCGISPRTPSTPGPRRMIVRAPNADLGRDPRWGRTEECYGEDPFFNGTMVTALCQRFAGRQSEILAVGVVAETLFGQQQRGPAGEHLLRFRRGAFPRILFGPLPHGV